MTRIHKSKGSCSGKVTIVEFLWVVLWMGGAVAGLVIGGAHFGLVGALVGIFLGFGVGLLISGGVAFILNLVVKPVGRDSRDSTPNRLTK